MFYFRVPRILGKKRIKRGKTYFWVDKGKSELGMNCIWQVWMTQKW